MIKLTFLGTACMAPTKDRNTAGIFLEYFGEGILFDCGEGIQRQLRIAGIPPTKITKILISHWHGDHVLGLPGLLHTLAASDYRNTLQIIGPKGTSEKMTLLSSVIGERSEFEIRIMEFDKKASVRFDRFRIETAPLDHDILCLGYSFIENDRRRIKLDFVHQKGIPDGPLLGQLQNNQNIRFKAETITPEEATYIVKGKRVTYVTDTLLCNNCVELSKDSDLLMCEAVYTTELEEKAEDYKHLTAKQAATIASMANVKKLILTHISQRYKTTESIETEAKDIFPNVQVAYDFLKVRV